MGFRQPRPQPQPVQQLPPPPPTPASPRSPSYASGASYNPFTSAFQHFRMNPFLVGVGRKKAGRPSLVRGRPS